MQFLNSVLDRLTDTLASVTVLAILAVAVFWLAAKETVILVASVTLWALCAAALITMAIGTIVVWQWAKLKHSRLRRDKILADVEAETAQVDLAARKAAIPLWLGQVSSGKALPNNLGGITSTAYALPVIKHFENELPALTLPELVKIESHVQADNVSLSRLFLGVGPGNETIRGSLKELSHVGCAGTSRWGKSIFMQCLLYQIILAKEESELYLSDIGGTSFIDFGLPYADDVATTERLAGQLWDVTMERKAKYQATGQGVRSLDMFNSLTGDNLPSVIFAADETTVLMSQSKTLTKHLTNLVSYAAKYGIFLILSGQNWKSVSVPSELRDQFSSRFQFKSMDHRQASILIPGSAAQDINVKGRCAAWIPERGETVMMQCPLIEPATLQSVAQPAHALLGDNLPTWDIETEAEQPAASRAEEIRKLAAEGMSKTDIARHFGYKSNAGAIYYEIRAALESGD